VTAHDGFTLVDLVSYDRKHNEANGEVVVDTTAETLPCPPAVPPVLAAQSVLLLRVLGD